MPGSKDSSPVDEDEKEDDDDESLDNSGPVSCVPNKYLETKARNMKENLALFQKMQEPLGVDTSNESQEESFNAQVIIDKVSVALKEIQKLVLLYPI